MFYANITVRTTDQAAVARAMTQLGRTAFVAPALDGVVVVFDAGLGVKAPHAVGDLAKALSKALHAAALGVLNDDDDALMYWLSQAGDETDHYNSWGADDRPVGGDARLIARAFGDQSDLRAIDRVLGAASEDGYAFAVERHEDLVDALGLPPEYMFLGYATVADRDNDEDIPRRDAFLVVRA